jgi:nucleoside-diphosphate-sugar epimerase
MRSQELKPETALAEPVSIYGESKLRGEQELLKFKDKFPVSIIRPPIVYGPRDQGIFIFFQTLSYRLMPMLKGATPDQQKYFSIVHMTDLCDGILKAGLASSSQVPSGEAFFITSGETVTFSGIMQTIESVLGKKALRVPMPKVAFVAGAVVAEFFGKLTNRPAMLSHDKLKELFEDYWLCSDEKARKLLGYKSSYQLARGMSETVDWYRRNKWI